jgi:hypothetical protein
MPVFILFSATEEEYSLDITESVSPEYTADVTQHAVESGSPVTDHRIIQPKRLTLSGLVTDVPLDATGSFDPESIGKHTELRERLEKAHATSELLLIDCGPTRGLYENMAITSLAFGWDYDTGNAFRVGMSLQEIVTIEAQVRNLTADSAISTAKEARIKSDAQKELDQTRRDVKSGDGELVIDEETRSRYSGGRQVGARPAGAASSELAGQAAGL